ncbi:hypothetical protein NHX12_003074 [Muraenolepis orangiensis]|uniref:Uncharacterized protein n=1 Tax=Muraenolepis orangiensis TaxID=630683 RepID=A0A9Q0DXC3_9TELE|nr:hypothetical protein NHX12_003074 [Muraenolepis orangiensis]
MSPRKAVVLNPGFGLTYIEANGVIDSLTRAVAASRAVRLNHLGSVSGIEERRDWSSKGQVTEHQKGATPSPSYLSVCPPPPPPVVQDERLADSLVRQMAGRQEARAPRKTEG